MKPRRESSRARGRIAFTVPEITTIVPIGERMVYHMLATGQLRRIKVGTRTIVPAYGEGGVYTVFGEPK